MRKNVLQQLFDVRPITASGEIDAERIERVARLATVDLRGKRRILPFDYERRPSGLVRSPLNAATPAATSERRGNGNPANNEAEQLHTPEPPPKALRQTILAAKPLSHIELKPPPTVSYEESSPRLDSPPASSDRSISSDPFAKTELLQALAHVNSKDRASWVELAHAPTELAPTTLGYSRQLRRVQQSVALKTTAAVKTPAPEVKQGIVAEPDPWEHPSLPARPNSREASVKQPTTRQHLEAEQTHAPRKQGHQKPAEEPRPLTQRFEPPAWSVASVPTTALPAKELGRVIEGIFSPSLAAYPKLFTIKPKSRRIFAGRWPYLKTTFAVIGVLALMGGGAGIWGGFKSRIQSFVQKGGDAFVYLEEGLALFEKGDWGKALRAFNQAKKGFETLSDELKNSGIASVAFAKGEERVNTGRSFISIGKEVSEIGTLLVQTAQLMHDPDVLKKTITLDGSGQTQPNHIQLFENINKAERYLVQASGHFETLKSLVAGIDPAAVPVEYQEKFFLLEDKLPELEARLDEGLTSLPLFKHALGEDAPRRYLILLENSSELRATGGFPGTYGLAEFRGGRLTKFFFDGIYNPDGQLSIRVAPPKALQRVSPLWGMRDAGWFFHFPTSAKKFAWFYEQAGGPRVDGVIAVTPRFVERLLALTGAFSMPEYGQNVINERNFIEVLQFEVEDDFDPRLGNPKKIITDLAPKVFERLGEFQGRKWESLFDVFEASLHEKDVQAFSFDGNLQEFIERKGWGGEMTEPSPGQDYLAVVHTNVAGGKADWVTDDELLQEISISEDGTMMKTVSVTRRHKGGKTPYTWWNAENKDYMRLLVPRGAALLAADGLSERDFFSRTPRDGGVTKDPDIVAMEGGLKHERRHRVDTFQEQNRDAIAGWLMVPPGESRRATFRYRLPERFDPANRFVVHTQKQAGLKPYPVTTRIIFPAGWSIDHQPEGATLKPGFMEITQPFDRDIRYDIGFTRQ